MTPLQVCLNYLDGLGICYSHICDATMRMAGEIGSYTSANILAETVVMKDAARYLLVVIPAESYVEIGKVSSVVGTNMLRFASEAEMSVLFPFGKVDSIPPFGGLFGMPVYLDSELADQETIDFTACTRYDLIHMRTDDFQRIAQPVVGSFSGTDYQREFRHRLLAKAAGA